MKLGVWQQALNTVEKSAEGIVCAEQRVVPEG